MARYIDADALKQTFCAECSDRKRCDDCDIDYHFEHLAPTADVVERKKGMWNIIQGNIVVCSVCGMNAPQSMTGCLINRHLEPNKSNFCPNCGADMRKEVK